MLEAKLGLFSNQPTKGDAGKSIALLSTQSFCQSSDIVNLVNAHGVEQTCNEGYSEPT